MFDNFVWWIIGQTTTHHVRSRPTTYCNGNEQGGYVIFAFFKYDDLERILFILGPIPTHRTNCEQCSCFCSNCRTDFNALIWTTPKPEPTWLLLRMVGHLRWPPIDGLSGGWMNHPPSIIMPLGLCQTNGVGLDVRMKCCVKNFQTGLHFRRCSTVHTIPESNQIKSNQISDYKPTEQIRHRAD